MTTPAATSIPYTVAGTEYIGYLALPAARPHASVLVCHEGTGLGPQVRVRCDQLAALGYAAFALDYVGGGEVLPDLAAMQQRLGVLRRDPGHARALGRAGLAVLAARPEVDAARIAAIGYCYGGTLALELARDGAALAATVAFHAGLDTRLPAAPGAIRGPVLACIGADDPLVPPDQRAGFEAEMRAAGADWRLALYGGAVHGFANPAADALGNPAVRYHAPTHQRSWRAMLDAFSEVFGAA